MSKRKIIFVGPAGGNGIPNNGASAKNYHLMKYFKEKGINVVSVDTESWKKNPFVLIKLAYQLLINPKAIIIISANNVSSYRVFQIMSLFPRKRKVIYWIIGGSIADWIKNGIVGIAPFKIVDYFLTEGKKMQKTFIELGFNNTIYVPNFKCIDYLPNIKKKDTNKVRFVFLSRIIPEKGCNTILSAVQILNKNYSDSFLVDFYGPIEPSYSQIFMNKLDALDNVSYKGFLDLRNQSNYNQLAEYHAMLFPTYWHGEGFPGIIIDAFISGLPVIASDWSLNAEILEDGKTGVIIKENSAEALANVMAKLIENPATLQKMSAACHQEAMNYDIKNVVTNELLEKLGIC